MPVPTQCPECYASLSVTFRNLTGTTETATVVSCPSCDYEETFS